MCTVQKRARYTPTSSTSGAASMGMSPSTLRTFSSSCALKAADGKLRSLPVCTGPPGWLLELPALCTVSHCQLHTTSTPRNSRFTRVREKNKQRYDASLCWHRRRRWWFPPAVLPPRRNTSRMPAFSPWYIETYLLTHGGAAAFVHPLTDSKLLQLKMVSPFFSKADSNIDGTLAFPDEAARRFCLLHLGLTEMLDEKRLAQARWTPDPTCFPAHSASNTSTHLLQVEVAEQAIYQMQQDVPGRRSRPNRGPVEPIAAKGIPSWIRNLYLFNQIPRNTLMVHHLSLIHI